MDLALQLLESSSAGKDVDSFRQTKAMLSKALKGSVDSKLQSSLINFKSFLIATLPRALHFALSNNVSRSME